ncbi:hypothetical protein [Enterococcus hulanensis]|uniref:hypothetical protein n=1 Tax=Enterococcus hulanensis TaxID=2559929 RepID=UPI0010FA3410|nr:hypothetical protein [Enterococcus hulanensis]
MRLNKQKVFRTALMGYFLASTFILSGAAFANTEASEEVSTVPSTTQSEKAVSSSGPELPTLNSSKEDVPTASTQKVEEPKRELTYEDNQMLEEPKADSPVPAVHFQEKQLENRLTIKGSVSAGEEVRENVPSQTILSALILQRLTEAGTWQEVHRFSIEGNGVNVTDSAFSFDYEKPVTETGESNYRLAADYTVKYSEEDQEQQKASLDVGSVTKVKEEVQEKPSETASSSQESTTSEQGSTEVTKENIVESSGPKEDSNAEEPIVIDPSTMGTGDDSPKTLGNNSQIPAMQDNYREAFQRGLGIMPMAFETTEQPTINSKQISNPDPNFANINYPVIDRLVYTKKNEVTMFATLNWSFRGYGTFTAPTLAEAESKLNSTPYQFSLTVGSAIGTPAVYDSNGKTVNGSLTLGQIPLTNSAICGPERIKNLSNTRTAEIRKVDFSEWEVWSTNVTKIEVEKIPTNNNTKFEYFHYYQYPSSAQIFYTFGAPKTTDLKFVAPPKFSSFEGNGYSARLEPGSYTGDISQKPYDGILQVKGNDGLWKNHVTDLQHDVSKNGSYSGKNFVNVLPGTNYEGRVILNDVFDTQVISASTPFYTPNNVETPIADNSAFGVPTTENDATATITGKYIVSTGTNKAHPKEVQVRLYNSNTGIWDTVSSTFTVNKSAETVTYKLLGLKQNSTQRTRYRVKNDSGVWSSWSSELVFKTKGVPLRISKPVIDGVLTKHNEVTMKSGTYAGQTSTDPTKKDNGYLWYQTGGGSWVQVTNTLPYTQTLGGTYSGKQIQGLDTGTAYKIRLLLMDSTDNYQYDEATLANNEVIAHTKNTVLKPTINTHPAISKYNASATISGVYGIGPAGTTPAHPDKVKVQVKLDGAPNWEDVDSSSSPKLDSQSINTSSTKGTFTISKLKASTKYHVRYQVENLGGWSDWSASEEFVTLAPPPALKIIDAPKLDFGMLQSEKFTQTANLSAASQKNHLTVDNTDTTKGWKLTAALQQLKRTDNPSIVMPWAKLTMPINLQNSIDDGVTWSNYATGVDGIPRTMSFNSGDPAQKLWGIVNPTDAQGLFRTEIDWSNVELEVPGNQYELYEGKLVWSLDDTP